ncbi:12352_t:CDS:2 [Entrophospora sp. SA101]|nr:12352_t:CDS:2 [Entrophospora sp. SA101]
MLNTKNDNNRDTKYNDTSKLFDDQTGNPISNKRLLTEHNKVSSSSPNKQIKKGKEIEGATFANENNTPPPVPPKTNIGSSSNQDVYDPFADAPPSITAQQIIDSLLPKTTRENNDIYNTAAAATDNLSPSSSNKKTEYNFQFSDPPINDYKHLFPGSPSADDFTKRNNETNRYPLGHTTRTSNEFKHLFPDDSSTDETNKYPSSESPYSSLGHTTKPSSDLFSDFPSADDSTKRNNETDKHPLGHTTRTSNELKRLFPDDSSTDDPTKKKVETNRDSFSKPQNKNSSKNKSSNRHSTQLPSSSTFAGDNNQFSFSDIDGLADNNSAENSNDEEDNNSEASGKLSDNPDRNSTSWISMPSMPSIPGFLSKKESVAPKFFVTKFHVHLPPTIPYHGTPVILGNVPELGSWEDPTIKLHKESATYWVSKEVKFPISYVEKNVQIRYKYAIVGKSSFLSRGSAIEFEGFDERDNRILENFTENQFDVWHNSNSYKFYERFRDFSFIKVIHKSITPENFKNQVMEYQKLLKKFRELTVTFTTIEFIKECMPISKEREKKLFLCVLLGYFINERKNTSKFNFYELPNDFDSGTLINSLTTVYENTFPSNTNDIIKQAVNLLIRHNFINGSFEWLKIFSVADVIDPKHGFLEVLLDGKYKSRGMELFIKNVEEHVKPYIDNIEDVDIYVKIAERFLQLCNSMPALLTMWDDIIIYRTDRLRQIFFDNIKNNLSQDNPYQLYQQIIALPEEMQNKHFGIFSQKCLSMLKNSRKQWGSEQIKSIMFFLQRFKWDKEEFLDALDNISKSTDLSLLQAFPEPLEHCFKTFNNIKQSKILQICNQWFEQIIDITHQNKAMYSNEDKFITIVFSILYDIYPTIGVRINIFNSLVDCAVKRVSQSSENAIYKATCSIAKFPEQIYTRYFHVVKETLEKSSISPNQQLIQKIREICGCKKGDKKLNIPNQLCELIMIFIMKKLQGQNTLNNDSEYYVNLFQSKEFWVMIFNATGSIEHLHSHELVLHYKQSINDLAELISDGNINFTLLKKLIVNNDENFIRIFNSATTDKKFGSSVIMTKTILDNVKKESKNYEHRLDCLSTFYIGFCQSEKVTDVHDYINNLEEKMKSLTKIKFNDILQPDHWAYHDKISKVAESVYRYRNSQTFKNIFELILKQDETTPLTVEILATKLIPKTFEEYEKSCKEYKNWEKLSCSDAGDFWKDVKDIKSELELMENFQRLPKERKFQETIWYLTQISNYKEGLKNLDQVIKIFQDSHDKENQIGIIYNSLNEGKLSLGVLINFFNKFNTEFKISNECWNLIKELSEAGTFVTFLKSIEGHDIKNLINSVDDHSDERLIQEDTVSSLIEVKQFLIPLLDVAKKRSVKEFVEEIGKVIKKNPKLTNNIVLCNNNCMALENMYKNIDQKSEVTKEKIKNAVMKGSYTFKRDAKGDKCNALMTYTSDKVQKSSYTFNDLQDLRGRALLIAKPTVVNLNLSVENALEDDQNIKNSMDVFVEQVDVAQDIINFSSKLVQIGHFEFRKFDVTVKGTDKMKELLKQCKEKLSEWEDIMNKAQENHYYLTFFPGRHILTFYDYFSNVNNPNVIEECQILIRFVNRRAELPSDKKIMGISSKKNNYYDILCEIGKKLQLIFEKLPKKIRQVKNIDDRVMSDVVLNGKLFVAACDEKLRVPNIIMSLYANNRSHPEPWQLLICTPLTTSEELTIFIKRCFFAANNGHKDHLFCIANLELLDFELQYNLVKFIRLMCKREKNYLLALICCREPGIHHHILDQFSQDVCVTNGLNTESMKTIFHDLCPNVTSLSSDLSGQGKTEWIKQDSFEKGKVTCSLLISDGLNFSKLVSQLKECKLRKVESLHLNIVSAENPSEVNMFLFELLILGIVSNSVDIAILPATEIYIEVASTTEQKLLNSMPITSYLRRKHLSWDINNLVISQEINSPIQIVCHYLNAFDRKAIEEIDILFKTDKKITVPLPANMCHGLITKYFFNQNADDVSSFRFIEIFVNVFADQLVRFSSSQYFQVENLKLMVKEKNIRSTLFDTLLEISKDFATKSIKTKAAQLESTSNSEAAKLGTIVKWDDSNHLLVFFMSQSPDSICALYRDKAKVPNNVKMLLKSQSVGQKKDELDDYNQLESKILLDRLEGLARRTLHPIKYPDYALSADNLIKMALILLRARANIPVIVCGEAGCGKTSLIAFLANVVEVDFKALNLHAGVQEEKIIEFVKDAQKEAEKKETWLFFDEINTCNHIGLLSDLIAHRMLEGKQIHPNIRLFSACNPYRFRTKSVSDAGLQTKVGIYDEKNRLVYQVKPLPDQILDYVWDYGVLQPEDEKKYIHIMLQDQLPKELLNHQVLTELLFASQQFIRKVEEPYSVSLRDVKRAIKLIKFFYEHLKDRPIRKRYPGEKEKPVKYPQVGKGKPSLLMRSYILALGLCYHSRLYEKELQEQEDNIKRMICPPNTAFNEALLENVLVMIVCMLTKIPVFIIGSPGSSKSLAVRLVSQNLRGADSNDPYFKKLPQVYLIPHQGSTSSTSEGILKVFEKANKYQDTSRKEFPVISVVLLDEGALLIFLQN